MSVLHCRISSICIPVSNELNRKKNRVITYILSLPAVYNHYIHDFGPLNKTLNNVIDTFILLYRYDYILFLLFVFFFWQSTKKKKTFFYKNKIILKYNIWTIYLHTPDFNRLLWFWPRINVEKLIYSEFDVPIYMVIEFCII